MCLTPHLRLCPHQVDEYLADKPEWKRQFTKEIDEFKY